MIPELRQMVHMINQIQMAVRQQHGTIADDIEAQKHTVVFEILKYDKMLRGAIDETAESEHKQVDNE